MLYENKTFTVPASSAKTNCCEACVFGSGYHASFCERDSFESIDWSAVDEILRNQFALMREVAKAFDEQFVKAVTCQPR